MLSCMRIMLRLQPSLLRILLQAALLMLCLLMVHLLLLNHLHLLLNPFLMSIPLLVLLLRAPILLHVLVYLSFLSRDHILSPVRALLVAILKPMIPPVLRVLTRPNLPLSALLHVLHRIVRVHAAPLITHHS